MIAKIAWIEDDTHIVEPVVEPLVEAGYEIARYRTAEEALRSIAEIRDSDLILLDIFLPPGATDVELSRFPGIDILRLLRKEYNVTTPVVVFTVIDREDILAQITKLGVDCILLKPILPSELQSAVEKAIASKSS